MSKVTENREMVDQFTKDLMSKIPITELYTYVTGEQFQNIQSRLKARNVLRQGGKSDTAPSMQEVPNRNMLWDFAEISTVPGKTGRGYNHIDVMLLSHKASTYKDAINFLAEYSHTIVPTEVSSNLGRDSEKRDFLAHLWAACRVARKTMFEDQTRFSHIREFADARKIPLSPLFWEAMDLGVWPERSVVEDIVELYSKKDKSSISDFVKSLPPVGNKAIVFPLYDKYGNFAGMTIRSVVEKRFWKIVDKRIGFYGLRNALAHDDVYVFEGELNYVQYAAGLYRLYGENKFTEYIPDAFCSGSRANSLEGLRDSFRSILYFPDIEEKKEKSDKTTQEVVIKVYNELRAKIFWAIDWGTEKNKFDLDDFVRAHIDDPEVFNTLVKMKYPIAEYLQRCIENEEVVVLGTNEQQKNGARLGYAQAYASQLYNPADQKALLDYYKHITEDQIDVEIKDQCLDSVDDDLGDGFTSKGNAYYIVKTDENGNVSRKKISDFVVKPRYTIVYQKRGAQSQGEFSGEVTEGFEMHATVHFTSGRKVNIFFEPDDLASQKDFKKRLLQSAIDLNAQMTQGFEEDIFKCASKRLFTSNKIIRFKIPGPHLLTECQKRFVLAPNHFGGSLKTFLNCEYSVIEDDVISNKLLNIEFEKSSNLRFGKYSDQEHVEISKIVWNDLRKVHYPEIVDKVIGFAASAGIKHLLEPNIQALVLFLHGKTHSFKTSTARLVGNMFGDFENDEQLGNFHGTFLQVEKSISAAGSNTMVFDEFKASNIWGVEELQNLIHNLYGGKSKGRLNTHSEEKERDPFHANVIFTGERALDLESSVEARHLQLRVERTKDDRSEYYNKVQSDEIRTKLKCFGARLIAWEFKHIDELTKVYQERKAGHIKTINEYGNKTRIATQCAMLDIGFYAFTKFCEESGGCSKEQADVDIQKFFIESTQYIQNQILRASETENSKRFIDCLRELIQTKTINMAIVSGEGQKASVIYTKGNNKNDVYIVKFTKKEKAYYAILSFKLVINAMNFAYRTANFTDSIKFDLAEDGYCKLDARRQISLQDIPDIGESEGKKVKRARVIVIPASKLEEESVSENQD